MSPFKRICQRTDPVSVLSAKKTTIRGSTENDTTPCRQGGSRHRGPARLAVLPLPGPRDRIEGHELPHVLVARHHLETPPHTSVSPPRLLRDKTDVHAAIVEAHVIQSVSGL